MLSKIIRFLQSCWDVWENVRPFVKRLSESKHLRKLIRHGESPPDTPAQEIVLVIAAVENPILYVGGSSFLPLVKIRRALWTARLQLSDLAEYALAARGEDNAETRSALNRIVGKWEKDALPLLYIIIKNPNTDQEIRRIAQTWIDKLEKCQEM